MIDYSIPPCLMPGYSTPKVVSAFDDGVEQYRKTMRSLEDKKAGEFTKTAIATEIALTRVSARLADALMHMEIKHGGS